jgi:hypothetical protein
MATFNFTECVLRAGAAAQAAVQPWHCVLARECAQGAYAQSVTLLRGQPRCAALKLLPCWACALWRTDGPQTLLRGLHIASAAHECARPGVCMLLSQRHKASGLGGMSMQSSVM